MRLEVLRHIEPRTFLNVEVAGGAAVRAPTRPTLEVGRRRVRPSPRSPVLASRAHDVSGIEEAPAPLVHRLGTGCGGVGRLPGNGECRPAMEGTSGAAERAHLRGWACEAALSRCACGSRARDARRRASVGVRGEPWEARAPRLWRDRRFRTALVTAHDMRCSSRSGRGKAPPASDRGGRGRNGAGIAAPPATPGPWNLGWPARASETGHPQPGTCPKGRDLREKSYTSGRLRVWCCGARTFVVVLVDRFDCRSRQAVPGIVRPRVKSARTTNAA
jgi:hypothetical protein